MAVDKIIAQIQKLSKDNLSLLQLKDYLKSEEKELFKHKQQLSAASQKLDLSQNSLGYLYLIEISGSSTEEDREFFNAGLRFVSSCHAAQIRLAPAKFVSLCKKLKDQALLLASPKQAIAPLMAAIQRLEASPEYITPIHVFVLQLCLLCKCYSVATSILSVDACEVDPCKTVLTATDFLLYCYYGARIHIGRKQYAQAIQMLLQALTAPTMVVNAITMAAYKKFVLVSLIHTGSVPSLPRFTPSTVLRATRHDFVAYHDLADAYGKADAAFQKVVAKHTSTFTADGNSGLMQLAVEARTKRAIQRLTQTYLTLSLKQIAESTSLASAEEAEQHLLRMVEAGDISAQIDDAKGMVHFLEDPLATEDPELMASIDKQITQSIKLAEKVHSLDYEVACDKAYLSKAENGNQGVYA